MCAGARTSDESSVHVWHCRMTMLNTEMWKSLRREVGLDAEYMYKEDHWQDMSRLKRRCNMKERLDVLLVKRNLAESREKAKAIIMSGNVFVDGQREDKAGTTFPDEGTVLRSRDIPFHMSAEED